MPRIPYTSSIDARSLRSNTPTLTASRDGNVYGTNVAEATGRVAAALGQAGGVAMSMAVDQKKQEREAVVADKVAQRNYTARQLELRNQVPADGKGYTDLIKTDYLNWVEEGANEIEDDAARTEYKSKMNAQLDNILTNGAQFEQTTKSTYSKDQANVSINAVQNKITQDPTKYDGYVKEGLDVIDARPDIPALLKEQMKTSFRNDAAKRRFEGMLDTAKTKADLDNIANDLAGKTGRAWGEELLPVDLKSLNDAVSAGTTAFETRAKADASAALTTQEERTKNITLIPQEELREVQVLAKESGDKNVIARTSRLMRDQEIIRQESRLPPAAMRSRIEQSKAQSALPTEAAVAISTANETFGISQAYLSSVLGKEYGGELVPNEQGVIDYGKPTGIKDATGKPTSSAMGAFQFIDDTWLSTIKSPTVMAAVGSAVGKDVSNMSDTELLDLRKDVKASAIAAAAYAGQNKATLERNLGRQVSDAEIYMAHFLGAGGGKQPGATEFLEAYRDNPAELASAMMPAAARANPRVFYWNGDKDQPKTVQEVYSGIADDFGIAPTRVAYEDNDLRDRIVKQTEKALAEDPISHAQSAGAYSVVPLSEEGGFEARGKTARAIADYYSIPISDMKPFTKDEAESLKTQIDTGTVQENLNIMSAIQNMGEEPSKAARLQIGQRDSTFGLAADLYADGNVDVASEIIKGRKRLQENPSIEQNIGASPSDLSLAYVSATKGAVLNLGNDQQQAIQDAATAHYIQKSAERNKIGTFDKTLYEQSVQAVTGNLIAEVNGQNTLLPPGLDGDTMEAALNRMTLEDYIAMSATGQAPVYPDGEGVPIDPQDISDEAVLQAIGDGYYRVMLSDNKFLVTAEPNSASSFKTYVFKPDVARIKQIAQRESTMELSSRNFNPMRM